MRLDPANFVGTVKGRSVGLFLLRSSELEIAICNHGARICQLLVPDRYGEQRDVVLGYESLQQLLMGMPSMGAFIGRFANRISKAKFFEGGQSRQLIANDGPHCIHGGPQGSRHQVFEVTRYTATCLTLEWNFLSVDDGFPGDVRLVLNYIVRDSTLSIEYSAIVNGATTPLNLTSHSFFNLEGEDSASVLDHDLLIASDHFIPVDADRIPLGYFEPVAGTAFDLRRMRRLQDALTQGHPQLSVCGAPGFDHTYLTPLASEDLLALQARLQASASGIAMEVWSNSPGLHLFSCAPFDGSLPLHVGKHGRRFYSSAAVCLEPQRLPDAPNHSSFGPCFVKAGERLEGRLEFRFMEIP